MSFCTLSVPFQRQSKFLTIGNNVRDSVKDIVTGHLHSADYYIECNGRIVSGDDIVLDCHCYHVRIRQLGGKGGFGSMLRALGAQIEKTTNREACRDLSGRRMRDINNEKKLREWAAKASEREKEKDERRRERRERLKAGAARHKFDDPQFDRQKANIAEQIDDALQEGLQKAGPSCSGTSHATKRKAAAHTLTDSKRARDWIGIDIDPNADSLSSSSDGETDRTDVAMQRTDQQASTSAAGASATEIPEAMDSSSSEEKPDTYSSSSSSSESDSQLPSTLEEVETEERTAETEGMEKEKCSAATGIEVCKEEEQNDHENEKETLSQTAEEAVKDADIQPTTENAETNINDSKQTLTVSGDSLNLDDYDSVESMQQLGLDVLKSALMARGLKCGGTLEQRAQRLFSVKGLSNNQIDPSLFAKPMKKK